MVFVLVVMTIVSLLDLAFGKLVFSDLRLTPSTDDPDEPGQPGPTA